MSKVCRSLFDVCWWLCLVPECCSLFVVYLLLFVCCCFFLLCVAHVALAVVSGLLFFVVCCLVFAVCRFVGWRLVLWCFGVRCVGAWRLFCWLLVVVVCCCLSLRCVS